MNEKTIRHQRMWVWRVTWACSGFDPVFYVVTRLESMPSEADLRALHPNLHCYRRYEKVELAGEVYVPPHLTSK